jgi:hypothetical protein
MTKIEFAINSSKVKIKGQDPKKTQQYVDGCLLAKPGVFKTAEGMYARNDGNPYGLILDTELIVENNPWLLDCLDSWVLYINEHPSAPEVYNVEDVKAEYIRLYQKKAA